MGHRCCSKHKVKRGLWSPEEDEKLLNFITSHGHSSWSSVPKLAGLERCGKSCRLRWINYLRPDLKRGSFTEKEEMTIIEVHRILGNRWAQIAKHLPGRTDNEVKNFWNSCIKKKLLAHGFDPNTHNLLPSPKPNDDNNNNNNNTNKIKKHKQAHDLVNDGPTQAFTVNTVRSQKKDNPTTLNVMNAPPPDTSSSFGIGLNAINNSTTTDVVTHRFGLMDDDPSIDVWLDSGLERFHDQPQQIITVADHLQLQEIGNVGGMEESELHMLKRLHMDGQSFDHLAPFSNTSAGSAFDFGFGDYDAIIQSGMYGGDVTSMDQVAWDIAN